MVLEHLAKGRMEKIMDFLKVIGRFGIRLLKNGDKYGVNGAVIWNGSHERDFGVEFFDVSNKEFGPQFVSRYYLSSLRRGTAQHGLCLDGNNSPTWDVSQKDFSAFMEAIEDHLATIAHGPSPFVFDGQYEPSEGLPCPVW